MSCTQYEKVGIELVVEIFLAVNLRKECGDLYVITPLECRYDGQALDRRMGEQRVHLAAVTIQVPARSGISKVNSGGRWPLGHVSGHLAVLVRPALHRQRANVGYSPGVVLWPGSDRST